MEKALSSCGHSGTPALNERLNTGPSLQNQLQSILVCAHFHLIAITGDIKQAIPQVRICEEYCDSLRFHWFNDQNSHTVETQRFTRVPFGLTCFPFLLREVLDHLFECCRANYSLKFANVMHLNFEACGFSYCEHPILSFLTHVKSVYLLCGIKPSCRFHSGSVTFPVNVIR